MIIEAKEYEKPETGTYVGVVADIVNLGMVQGKYGLKPKVRIVWLLNKKDSEGNYFRAMVQDTASMHEKSKLFKHASDILNAPVPDKYDLDNLIGRNNMLVIRRQEQAATQTTKKKIFANIESILPLPNGTAPFAIPQGFVRKQDQDRQQNQNGSSQPAQQAAAPVSAPPSQEVADEDIPF